MLAQISLIFTTAREGFDVQDLPHRATPMSQEQMSEVFGGCRGRGRLCVFGFQCCSSLQCRGGILEDKARRCR